MLEQPGDGSTRPQTAALVHVGIEALDHRARGSYLVSFAGALGVGSIAGHIQARGCHRADCVNHLVEGVGAAPGDQEEGGVHFRGWRRAA